VTAIDPKAFKAADKICFRNTMGFQGEINLRGAIQTYLEHPAADLVPRELYDAALLTIGAKKNERDEARAQIAALEAQIAEGDFAEGVDWATPRVWNEAIEAAAKRLKELWGVDADLQGSIAAIRKLKK